MFLASSSQDTHRQGIDAHDTRMNPKFELYYVYPKGLLDLIALQYRALFRQTLSLYQTS